MGQMVDGVWKTGWYEPDHEGAFARPETRFRSQPEDNDPSRYHLYVSYACPWAHRTIITRAVRGIPIGMTVVDPHMSDEGWNFEGDGGEPEPLFGAKLLREIYLRADAHYTGRVTVPVLWDKKKSTIVNNESREVMRILDTVFDGKGTLAPAHLVPQIDETLTRIYAPVNNGVYRAGFATKQAPYERAVHALFAELDNCESVLGKQRYLCGDVMTEADVALFTTLLRFDVVYYAHFKCNVRRIQDYPNLWGFLRDMYQHPAIEGTCRLDQIKTHYYWSQTTVNPTRVVPVGPTLDLDSPHGRGRSA